MARSGASSQNSLRRDLPEQLDVVLPVSLYFGHNAAEFWLGSHRIPRFVPLEPGIVVISSPYGLLKTGERFLLLAELCIHGGNPLRQIAINDFLRLQFQDSRIDLVPFTTGGMQDGCKNNGLFIRRATADF